MRARLIYNPSAGMRYAQTELEHAIEELKIRGWSLEIAETSRSHDAIRIARETSQQGFDVLIAVGGDGTMNEAANGLVGSGTALGVLPLGTGNVWAKEMGLPLGDLVAAARLLAEADVCSIDVGEVRGRALSLTISTNSSTTNKSDERARSDIPSRVFVLWCGIGLDAAVTRLVEPQREMKRRFGALFFWLVGIREAWNFRGKNVTIRSDGKKLRRRIILALAANAQLYGGITRIAPNARVDDGVLDLVVLKGEGAWETASHLVRVLLGLHVHDPQVDCLSVTEVKVEGGKLPVQVDGEPIGFTPVEIRVRPRALRVLVPKTANQSLFGD